MDKKHSVVNLDNVIKEITKLVRVNFVNLEGDCFHLKDVCNVLNISIDEAWKIIPKGKTFFLGDDYKHASYAVQKCNLHKLIKIGKSFTANRFKK